MRYIITDGIMAADDVERLDDVLTVVSSWYDPADLARQYPWIDDDEAAEAVRRADDEYAGVPRTTDDLREYARTITAGINSRLGLDLPTITISEL